MRALNMQALSDAIKRRHPGVVVYGIGDDAHKLTVSDHNEDDTAGVRAAQSDADSNPEHRAIDVMLGAAFTRAQAYALIADLLADPTARARLFYIIFDGWIWSRSTGWVRHEFDGDPHHDHPHISGWAADDENSAGWPAVDGDDMSIKTDPDGWAMANRVYAMVMGFTTFSYTLPNGTKRTETNKLAVTMAELDASVDAVAAAAGMTPEQLEAVKAAARQGAEDAVELALTPEALAAAIPDEFAAAVVQLLGDRQAAAARAAADVLDGAAS